MNIRIKNNLLPNYALLLLTFLFSSAFSLPANTPSDTENPTASLEKISSYILKKYHKDAVRLALRLSSENKNYHALDAEAPANLVESIYDALIAVHQSNLEGAKVVTELHKMHTFPVPSVDRFFLVYEKKAAWAKTLRMGAKETGSEKVNKLLGKYGLVIDRNSQWDEEHNCLHVRAKEPLNIAPLANDFKKINGVVLVNLLQPDGDGNDIEIEATKAGWQINYVLKFDSCIDGCKKKHFWSFEVNRQGEVVFLGEFGDDLPDWMKEDQPLAENR